MALTDSDDEEDSFVTIGNALATYAEDEVPQKPSFDQTVKDSKGRQRFHGAFTGGFSAGYFNSVGSAEGWTPSTFVSSRAVRADGASSRRPEDFMDEDDFADHGIAPKKVSTTEDFTTAAAAAAARKRKGAGSAAVIPGPSPLQDVIIPASVPVGMRLLRKLGWKDGQGIGPRVKRKAKRTRPAKDADSRKVYGCSLPTAAGYGSEGSQEESEEEYPESVTFAPKDVNPVNFSGKDNVHGLGYSGIDPSTALTGHFSLFEPAAVSRSGKIGIRGQAFGVGALEEDDDEDIYAKDHMSRYDMTLSAAGEADDTHGWTAPKNKDGGKLPVGYVGGVLLGFKLASQVVKPKKVFAAPQLPRGFRPVHVTVAPDSSPASTEANLEGKSKMDASARGAILGETPDIKSVFDLVSDKDQERMVRAKEPMHIAAPSVPPPSAAATSSSASIALLSGAPASVASLGIPEAASSRADKVDKTTTGSRWKAVTLQSSGSTDSQQQQQQGESASSSKDTAAAQRMLKTPLFTASSMGFKPFASDSAKQARYEKYLDLTKNGQKCDLEELATSQMTEWEHHREREEFVRAAQLYRPLSSMMAARFITAKFGDEDNKVAVAAEEGGDANDQKSAAKMKMFGKLTRDKFRWHPDKNLCKRFNVPNPYPDSTIVGLPTVKRDKYSVFNFLNAPTAGEQKSASTTKQTSGTEEQERDSDVKGKERRKISKPLAILATVDLTSGAKVSTDTQPTEDVASASNVTEPNGSNVMDKLAEMADDETRPPIDLFKAIFEDTDSSSEEEEKDDTDEEQEEKMDQGQTSETRDKIPQGQSSQAAGSSKSHVPVDTGQGQSQAQGSSEKSAKDSRWAAAGIFSVLADLDKDQDAVSPESPDSHLSSVPTSPTEHVVATPQQTGLYGPALPPPADEDMTLGATASTSEQSHKIHKHKHKDKKSHKHKKRKSSSKHKKHKLKKDKKHKKKKKKKKKKTSEIVVVSSDSSGSDADTESGSDSDARDSSTPEISHKEILQRLRSLPPTQRQHAADFM